MTADSVAAEAALVAKAARRWASRGVGFMRFLDGNSSNTADANLAAVDLEAALQRARSWECTWDAELDDDEADAMRACPKLRARALARYKELRVARTSIVAPNWCPSHDGVSLMAIAEPDHGFAFLYSFALHGSLATTALLALNVRRDVSRDDTVARLVRKTIAFLHARAAGGAPVTSGQVVAFNGGEVAHLMLVAAPPVAYALLRRGAVTQVSPTFRAAEKVGKSQVLLLVPLLEGEGNAILPVLSAVVADLAAHRSASSGLCGSAAGRGRGRVIS